MAELDTQLKKGTLELCILALVQKERKYGYDLVEQLKVLGMIITEGTLYPILIRLRTDGYLVATWEESDQGRPRKYYEITEKGKQMLSESIKQWKEYVAIVNTIISHKHT
ncbi:MAG: PadR family transcriptional regulator [Patescibacteria group bacterium]